MQTPLIPHRIFQWEAIEVCEKKNDEQSVMIVGQDEAAIFKQLLLNSKMWTGPIGKRPLVLPKDEGAGVMIS